MKAGTFVELPGFEPRQTESESVVLPLHHSSKCSPKLEKKVTSARGILNYFKLGGVKVSQSSLIPLPEVRFWSELLTKAAIGKPAS